MNFIKTIRNNWKKSAVAFGAVAYGTHYMWDSYKIFKNMRVACEEAQEASRGSDVKNILVILNPMAKKKKSEKLYRQYCEPILNLAGFSVEIFKTNYVGHAKVHVENLTKLPDAIVVAGGDGTSSEVVTGLMRRNDEPCPIVLLPLGLESKSAAKNSVEKFESSRFANVKQITEALRPMINNQIRYENLMRFDIYDKDAQQLRPVYGLSQFSWGILRDIDRMKDKYWYFGNLRQNAAAIFNAFSTDLDWKRSTKFEYTPPCPGCSKCFIEKKKPINANNNNGIFSKLFAKRKPLDETDQRMYAENAECSKTIVGELETNQLNVECNLNENEFYEIETKSINSLNPGIDFVKQISAGTTEIKPEVVLKSRTIKLYPEDDEIENKFYAIDGEEYEIRPVKITIIPKAIKLYG